MNDNSVSIIVPVYNAEKYITNCIKSIQNQTYSNLEIIIVDDGSFDQTADICEKFAQADKRIKVAHIKNGGVSSARNYGLSIATGCYIQFVDGDDYLATDATQKLVNAMEQKNVDLVVFGYVKILNELRVYNNRIEKIGFYTNKEYLVNTLKDPGHHYYGVVWNKFYRNDIIKKCKICFDEKVSLGEDFIFNLNYISNIKHILVIRKRLYFYNCTYQNTLSRYEKNIDMCKRELQNRYLIFEQYKKIFYDVGLYDNYKDRVQQYWLLYLAMNIYYIKYQFSDWEDAMLKEWLNILNNSVEIQKCKNTVSDFQLKIIVQHIRLNRAIALNIKRFLRKWKRIKAN